MRLPKGSYKIFLLYIIFFLFLIPTSARATSLKWTKSENLPSYSQEIRFSPSDKNIVFASLRSNNQSGLYKSINSGVTFFNVFPLSTGRDVNSIAISFQDTNKIWIGTYEQGIFSSIDGGNNWINHGFANTKVRFLAVDPSNDNNLYAGTGENNADGGIFKSIDGGNSWNRIGESTYGRKNNLNLFIDHSSPNIILAGSDFNLFKSVDSGNSWTPLSLTNSWSPATLIDNLNSSIIFSAANDLGIYKSLDFGQSWELKNSQMGNSLIFRLAQSDVGFLYASKRNGNAEVWRSNDSGENWENIGDPNWGNRNTWGLDVKNGRILVSVEGLGTFYADDVEAKRNPLVFIPGFAASWSRKGLVDKLPTTYADWQLFPVLGQIYYGPFLDLALNSGYTSGVNLFTFGYDYRRSIADSAQSLNDFLETVVKVQNPGVKINLVGHSMGGLVARYCFEKINGCALKINKIATVGTPHYGVLQAYDLWEGGVTGDNNLLSQAGLAMFFQLNKEDFASSKDAIQAKAPGVRDLLPIFNYIAGLEYRTMSLQAKNGSLESLLPTSGNFKSSLLTFNSNTLATNNEYLVVPANSLQAVAGLWPDGFPIRRNKNLGDGTVLISSSKLDGGSNFNYPDVEHSNYLRTETVNRDILEKLGMQGNSLTPGSQIVPHSIVNFVLNGPAILKIKNQALQDIGNYFDLGKGGLLTDPVLGQVKLQIIGAGKGPIKIDSVLANDTGILTGKSLYTNVSVGETKQVDVEINNHDIFYVDRTGVTTNESLTILGSRLNNKLVSMIVTDFQGKNKQGRNWLTLQNYYFAIVTVLAKETDTTKKHILVNMADILSDYISANISPTPVTLVQVNKQISDSQNFINRKNAKNMLLANDFLNRAKNDLSDGVLTSAFLLAKAAAILAL